MKNKYLTIINSLEDIQKLKNIGISKFLYPLKFFSVGFDNCFNIEDIKEDNSYILVNKIFLSKELDELKKIVSNLPSNIKGIVFDDLGTIEILKDLSIEKILYLNHFCTNYESINELLEYVDSLVISSDITLEEINIILKNSNKNLCIYGYGHLNLSYSKRYLNRNYSNYHKLNYKNKLELQNTDYNFITIENESGTVIYDKNKFNGLYEDYYDNVKYIIINLFNTEIEEFIQDVSKQSNYKGFLEKETIYKLKGGDI